jgi:hypothetical protein
MSLENGGGGRKGIINRNGALGGRLFECFGIQEWPLNLNTRAKAHGSLERDKIKPRLIKCYSLFCLAAGPGGRAV